MKRSFLCLWAAFTLLSSTVCAQTSPIQVQHPWARATAGAGTTSAAYLTLTDQGPADRLTGVSTPVAATAALHETINDSGVMKMRAVAGIALEMGKPVTLAPGAMHIMLMGLKAPLKEGMTFPMTLMFRDAPPMTVSVTVEAAGGMGEHHMH